jgi:hypothetical protein
VRKVALLHRWRPIEAGHARWAVPMLMIMLATLVQVSGSLAVISKRLLDEWSIADGTIYINQARSLQCCASLVHYAQYGLYPAFLSLFDYRGQIGWQAKDPAFFQIYFAQALLLAASSAFFLFVVVRTSAASFLWRLLLLLALSLLLLSPLVVLWPALVLIEGLAISGLLLLLACCVCADTWRNSVGMLTLVFLVTVALMLVRDPLIFLAVALAVLICANALSAFPTNLQRVSVVVLAGIVLAVAFIKIAPIQSTGKRDNSFDVLQSLATLVQMRILPDESRRHFFVERGMPESSIVLARTGKLFFEDPMLQKPDEELRESFPGLIEYREWMRARGARTYVEFLVTHPGYLWRSLWRTPSVPRDAYAADVYYSIADLFSRPLFPFYGVSPWPTSMTSFLLAPFGWLIPLLYLLAAATNYVVTTIRRRPASLVDSLALSAGVALFLSYHSDAWDVWRHTVPFILTIYIALIVRAFQAAAWRSATARTNALILRGRQSSHECLT